MMQISPRKFNTWHSFENRLIWWKNVIKEVVRVRWCNLPIRKCITVFLLLPWKGRTRIYNRINISLISHQCYRQWHVHLDRYRIFTWSTWRRKSQRILQMRSVKRNRTQLFQSLTKTRTYHKNGCETTKISNQRRIHSHPNILSFQLTMIDNWDRRSWRCFRTRTMKRSLIDRNNIPI